jgi:hypothetical protein
MTDIITFLFCNSLLVIVIVILWALKCAWFALLDKFVDYIYKRIKEKEMGEYIEHQFDNSRRKHVP